MTEHICLGGRESKSSAGVSRDKSKRSSPLCVRQPQPRQSWEVIKISAIIACLERCTLGRKDALALQRRREQSKIISHCVQRLPPTQLPHKALLYSHVNENTNANANTNTWKSMYTTRTSQTRRKTSAVSLLHVLQCNLHVQIETHRKAEERWGEEGVCAQGGGFWVTGSLLVPHLVVTAGSWEPALPLGEHLGKIPLGPP